MTHHLWVIISEQKFYKNDKKIEETLESEDALESHYVMWCNGLGLANLVELSQKHARKCKETCVPLLNGFKVRDFQGSPDPSEFLGMFWNCQTQLSMWLLRACQYEWRS